MLAIDLHTHSRFFHGFAGRPTPYDPIGAQLLAVSGRWHDLDAVALTNHDYYASFPTIGSRPSLIPGIEVTTSAGHVLVVGPDPPSRTAPGELSPEEVVSVAHDRDCVAIIAHPFRRSHVRESGAEFDAVEINGKHTGEFRRVQTLSDALGLPIVGGSDAHYPFEAGRAFTRIDAARPTAEAVVAAIRDGRVEPVFRGSHLDRTMQTAYRYVHEYL